MSKSNAIFLITEINTSKMILFLMVIVNLIVNSFEIILIKSMLSNMVRDLSRTFIHYSTATRMNNEN